MISKDVYNVAMNELLCEKDDIEHLIQSRGDDRGFLNMRLKKNAAMRENLEDAWKKFMEEINAGDN